MTAADARLVPDGTHAVFPEGMTWPALGGPLDALEWRLRNAPAAVDARDMVMAATVLAAFRALVACPRAKREHVVRGLRACVAPDADDDGAVLAAARGRRP